MANYKIEYFSDFQEDLLKIVKYLRTDLKTREIPEKFAQKLIKKIEVLSSFPYLYQIDQLLTDQSIYEYRKMPYGNFLLFYRIDESLKCVYVVRLVYAKRNYLGKLELK